MFPALPPQHRGQAMEHLGVLRTPTGALPAASPFTGRNLRAKSLFKEEGDVIFTKYSLYSGLLPFK